MYKKATYMYQKATYTYQLPFFGMFCLRYIPGYLLCKGCFDSADGLADCPERWRGGATSGFEPLYDFLVGYIAPSLDLTYSVPLYMYS